MQGTAADVLQTVGHGATLTGSKPSQWRQGQWRQQTCGPQCPGPCPKGGVLGAETEFFLKGGQCGKFCKNEGPFGKKINRMRSVFFYRQKRFPWDSKNFFSFFFLNN
jgi:hypothetical protein